MGLVDYETKDKLAYISLNRPEKFNAINFQMFEALWAAFNRYETDPDAWVAILVGKGRSFCAGHDHNERRVMAVDELFVSVLNLSKPLIVAVQGHCVGMALALVFCSDIRIGTKDSQYGWPNVRLGVSSIGGPAFMPHFLPRNFGYEYMFTGDLMPAQEAFRLGLLNHLTTRDTLMATAEKVAGKILANAPLAVQAMKEATLLGFELPIEQRLKISKMIAERVADTDDAKEGALAFSERRKPVWSGK
jgi:enoyl-CoA hydratase/carnithine racemase